MAQEGRQTSSIDWASPDDSDDAIQSELSEDEDCGNGRARQTLEKLLDGKEKEWSSVIKKDNPLHLLDLPVDILKEIVKEVTHTNDLTSLALTCSAMHSLTIPHIYSRFDIVWPDNNSSSEPRTGVDALTFGLSTLVMGKEVFGEHHFPPSRRRRRGNDYAQNTRKFSLGNGPDDWVKEYTLHKEGGKMLGTLVALAVARMRNLESFVWDMPTGVIRDVWLALSSLAEREDGIGCRLERLHVRWHDNHHPDQQQFAPGSQATHLIHSMVSLLNENSKDRVEHPSLSVVPPLRSLSVLDIDELAYLDEMSVLIAKSAPRLRELRVSVAKHAKDRDWYASWEALRGVLYSSAADYPRAKSERRMGGVLGTLFGHFLSDENARSKAPLCEPQCESTTTGLGLASTKPAENSQQIGHAAASKQKARFVEDLPASPPEASHDKIEQIQRQAHETLSKSSSTFSPSENGLSRLPIEILELQGIPLCNRVLGRALDWRKLTELTLLDCTWSDVLWKILRQQFTPKGSEKSRKSSFPSNKAMGSRCEDYSLALRKIHTNMVSNSLISFLKETLAPNSLEILFLQSTPVFTSPVTVEQIIRGPLRRHRTSLRKLTVDGTWKKRDGGVMETSKVDWVMKRNDLTFLINRKMQSLKELCICIDYKDWHFFLQRLPNIDHLRSLFVPFMSSMNMKRLPIELALQIVDVAALVPHLQLSYMGILYKCYEILEGRAAAQHPGEYEEYPDGPVGVQRSDSDPLEDEGGDDDDVDDDADPDDADDGGPPPPGPDDDDDDDSATDGAEASESEPLSDTESDEEAQRVAPKLREILFYDDKVAVFKARHGKL